MSLVRLGAVLCETDETMTFSPARMFPRDSACMYLVTAVSDPDDLTEVSIDGNTACVHVTDAPIVDATSGDVSPGACGEPPQFVVASTQRDSGIRQTPIAFRAVLKTHSPNHLFMSAADITGFTPMPRRSARSAPQKDRKHSKMPSSFGILPIRPPQAKHRHMRMTARVRHTLGALRALANKKKLKAFKRWAAQCATKEARHSLVPAEETFFAVSKSAVRCWAGLAALPPRSMMLPGAVDGTPAIDVVRVIPATKTSSCGKTGGATASTDELDEVSNKSDLLQRGTRPTWELRCGDFTCPAGDVVRLHRSQISGSNEARHKGDAAVMLALMRELNIPIQHASRLVRQLGHIPVAECDDSEISKEDR